VEASGVSGTIVALLNPCVARKFISRSDAGVAKALEVTCFAELIKTERGVHPLKNSGTKR
jgi:hypothetical protein